MDRIHRNSRNFMAMMDDLRKGNQEFASVTESLDTSTAMGRFVMDIIQRIAQLESDQIGERTYVGMEQKAKTRAGNLGKPAPFGYRYGATGSLEPIEAEVALVRKIFAEYLKGAKRHDIAQNLAESGSKTRAGKPWTRWNVAAILANPTYAGATQWDDTINWDTHPAIVERPEFLAVQEKIMLDSPAKADSRRRLLTNNAPVPAN
jgi:site-specific DNA recombinase